MVWDQPMVCVCVIGTGGQCVKILKHTEDMAIKRRPEFVHMSPITAEIWVRATTGEKGNRVGTKSPAQVLRRNSQKPCDTAGTKHQALD